MTFAGVARTVWALELKHDRSLSGTTHDENPKRKMPGSKSSPIRKLWRIALKSGGRFRPTVLKRKGRTPWVQPWDMTDKEAKRVAKGEICGAPKATKPGYCHRRPSPENREKEPPCRCERHGSSPGAPKGNQNALVHGMYRNCMDDEEWALFQVMDPMDLSQEIAITKVRLRRMVALEKMQALLLASDKEDDPGKALVLFETSESIGGPEGLTNKVVKRTTDYSRLVHRIVGQVARLHARQTDMERVNQEMPLVAQDIAAAMREAVAGMDASMNE